MKTIACFRSAAASVLAVVTVGVAVVILALAPAPALAYGGGTHVWATEAAAELFGAGPNHPNVDPMEIDRNRPVPLLPELELVTEWYDTNYGCCDEANWMAQANFDWMRWAAQDMDDIESDTRHHFWFPEEGMHECPNDVAGINNAWETIHSHWVGAIDAWQAGSLGEAYAELGYAMHFVGDGGQPAHANEDMHPGDALSDDDSLEDWSSGDYARASFYWNTSDLNAWPGPILWPPHDNAGILNTVLNSNGGYWDRDQSEPIAVDSDWADFDAYFFDLNYPYSVYNKQQLFYIMYVVNQTGNYFASDSEPGDTFEGIGWLNGYAGLPTTLHCPDCEDGWTWAQDSDGLNPDNDGYECTDDNDNDDDGDLSMIMHWAYGAAFRAMPGMLDLFRRTMDAVPPVSTVETTRIDFAPVREWNNVPVIVKIVSATDYANPYLRASGVWKRWGKIGGVTPSFTPDADQTPYWSVNTEGVHQVELLSTDMMGNVETGANDFVVRIDMTPPQVSFADLRPNYLTSETFTATWTTTDALSGVDSEIAYLDDMTVANGQVFDLAQMAGVHTLRVIAFDEAQNWTDVTYTFEVWIAANGWCQSVLVNRKTQGESMTCVVEFPAFYSVGLIQLESAAFAVKGYIDLFQQDPVVGQTADLPALLLTGVGDHDMDGVADRKLRFDKDAFVAALYGQVGAMPSVIRGGLLPSGTPRYLAPVVVPVFRTPK